MSDTIIVKETDKITVKETVKIAQIPLSQGKVALVNKEDHGWLSKFRWCAVKIPVTNGFKFYAKRTASQPRRSVYLHQELAEAMGWSKNVRATHINGDGLDNTRSNLKKRVVHLVKGLL